jgi:hypothetical protein
MTADVLEIRGSDVHAASHSQAGPEHQATYGTWPRGSMGEDALDEIGIETSEKQAA